MTNATITDRELAALAAARLVVRALLAGEKVKHVKWICEHSNENIGISMLMPDGEHVPFERILIRFVNGYKRGVRFVAGPMPMYGWEQGIMSYGEVPASIGHDCDECYLQRQWRKYEKYDDAVAKLMADFLSCTLSDEEIPFTTPRLPMSAGPYGRG